MKYNYLNIKKLFVAITFTSLILSGCGKKNPEEIENVVVSEDSVEQADSGEIIDEDKNAVSENISETDEAENEAADENDSDVMEDIADSFCENNGDYCIKVGNKLFFHAFLPESESNQGLWNQYIFSEVESCIYSYDLTSNNLECIYTGNIDGKLFYVDGRIYFEVSNKNDEGDWEHFIASMEPDGSNVEKMADSDRLYLSAVDEETQTLIVNYYDEEDYSSKIGLCRDGQLWTKVFDSTGDPSFITAGEGYLVYTNSIREEDSYYVKTEQLMSYDISTGEKVLLGELEPAEYGGYRDYDSIEIIDGRLYILTGIRAGTGNFLNAAETITATLFEENSLICEAVESDMESDSLPYMSFENKECVLLDANPDELSIHDGNLYINSATEPLAKDLYEKTSDDSTVITTLEEPIVFGRDAFIRYNTGRFNSIASIGWRDGYNRLATYYAFVNLDSGELTPLCNALCTKDKVYCEIWYPEGIENVDILYIESAMNDGYMDTSFYAQAAVLAPNFSFHTEGFALESKSDYDEEVRNSLFDFLKLYRAVVDNPQSTSYNGSYNIPLGSVDTAIVTAFITFNEKGEIADIDTRTDNIAE